MTSRPELPSGTVTFLFTDIEGSTQLLKQLGRDGYESVLAEHAGILRAAFTAHGGQVVDTQGDSFFASFQTATDAVAAAVDAQRELEAAEWPEPVRVRMGLHSAEPKASGERYVGIGVHRAARVGSAAHGGQILASDSTRALVEDDLPAGVYLRELGAFQLKDIDRPERITQVAAEGLQVEFPALRGAERVKERPATGRRSLLAAALIGVIAAAVAVPLFSLGGGGSSSAQAFAGVAGDSVGVFRAASGSPIAQAQVGTGPNAIATGSGGVWVANTDDNSVSRVDPDTNAVVQTISVGNQPSAVAVGDGFVWVANTGDGTVSQIDPGTNKVVRTIRQVGNQPVGVAYGEGGVWVSNASDKTVVRIDPISAKVAAPIPVASGADAVAVGEGSVWVASRSAGSIVRIDPHSGSEQVINVGNGPTAIAISADSVWVANSLDNTVSQIDPTTNRQQAVVRVGAGPSGVVAAQGLVWVSNQQGGTLSRIDPAKGNVVQTVETGNRPADLTLNGSDLYVAVHTSSLVHRGGKLILLPGGPGYGKPVDHFDPATAYDTAAWQHLMLTNDGLVTYQRAGGSAATRLVPDLAVSLPLPTDGGKTYTFQLRPGVRYSNGALVQSADFRSAIKRALIKDDGAAPSSYFSGIVGAAACVKTPDRCDLSKGITTDPATATISFHLVAPDPDFLYKLALPTADALPANTPIDAPYPLPATGPYEVKSFQANGAEELVRNPRFHEWSAAAQPNGYPDEITITYGGSPQADVNAVQRGAADLTTVSTDVPAAIRADLRIRHLHQLHTNPALTTNAVYLNTRLPPFNDVRVRQALNYAVDRNSLVDIEGGHDSAQVTCQILPPNLAGYHRYCPYTIRPSRAGNYNGPDLAKARRLVAASGTRGQTVALWKGAGYPDPPLPYLLSVLRELGYKAEVKQVSRKVFSDLYTTPGSNWQAVDFGWSGDYPAASTFFLPIFTCASFTPKNNSNFSEFCRPKIDAQITQASALQTSDPQAAAKLWAKVDRDVVNQAPWVPFDNPRFIDLVSRRVGNYIYSPWLGGSLLDQLWVR
jgi:YVTN family beta-propeller protein